MAPGAAESISITVTVGIQDGDVWWKWKQHQSTASCLALVCRLAHHKCDLIFNQNLMGCFPYSIFLSEILFFLNYLKWIFFFFLRSFNHSGIVKTFIVWPKNTCQKGRLNLFWCLRSRCCGWQRLPRRVRSRYHSLYLCLLSLWKLELLHLLVCLRCLIVGLGGQSF